MIISVVIKDVQRGGSRLTNVLFKGYEAKVGGLYPRSLGVMDKGGCHDNPSWSRLVF